MKQNQMTTIAMAIAALTALIFFFPEEVGRLLGALILAFVILSIIVAAWKALEAKLIPWWGFGLTIFAVLLYLYHRFGDYMVSFKQP